MTLVSHTHRFIYLKTIKTAGTTTEQVLEQLCAPSDVLEERQAQDLTVTKTGVIAPRRERIPDDDWWSHMSAADVKARLGEDVWASYRKIVNVRNPFDKAVSWFYYAAPKDRFEAVSRRGPQALKRFFQRWIQLRVGDIVDRGQYLLDGALIADTVIRFETLEADLSALRSELGVHASELPRVKYGERRKGMDYRALYDDASRDAVAAAFAYELETFGYRF